MDSPVFAIVFTPDGKGRGVPMFPDVDPRVALGWLQNYVREFEAMVEAAAPALEKLDALPKAPRPLS